MFRGFGNSLRVAIALLLFITKKPSVARERSPPPSRLVPHWPLLVVLFSLLLLTFDLKWIMPRKPRNFQIGHSYHITTRCNNREFKLSRRECREVFLYAIKKVSTKYNFRLYALCIMSNHVHYLIEPLQPEDLPKIMHYLNWYTAMCFNRMLKRTGHFWEKRYYCNGFPSSP